MEKTRVVKSCVILGQSEEVYRCGESIGEGQAVAVPVPGEGDLGPDVGLQSSSCHSGGIPLPAREVSVCFLITRMTFWLQHNIKMITRNQLSLQKLYCSP